MKSNKTKIVTDDITAWHEFPNSRWMLNKLQVFTHIGTGGPVGIAPESYPVYVKPAINVHGLGIGSKKVESRFLMDYQPGMMWMPFYTGDHMSYDIKYENGEIVEVYAAKGLNGPYFTEWQVDKIEPDENLEDIIFRLSMIGPLPDYFNIETIGGNLIECHPRWSLEFVDFYDLCPFKQLVMWTEDKEAKIPDGWIDCSGDPCNQWTGEKIRKAYTYTFEE